MEYSGSVWDPLGVGLQDELWEVKNQAATFVTGNYNYETGSMAGIHEHLKWESLKKQRRDNRLILLYKGLKGKAIWASSWDYDTYHIGDQRRFRRACASAQSRQSLRCSHTRSMEVDEGSSQKSDI